MTAQPHFKFCCAKGAAHSCFTFSRPRTASVRGLPLQFPSETATAQLHFNFASQKGLRTLASLSHAPEQQVFRGCLHTGNSSKGAPCRPPASYVSAANSALDLDLFPSALHSQVSRRALFAPALPFPIRRMQTIEKRRYLGCVFCILMYPLRFSSERKRVCMADGNDSVRCKTARRLTVRSSAPLPPASSPRSFRYPPCK